MPAPVTHPVRGRKLVASIGGRLIFLCNRISGQSFLVDTGAAHSVLPHRSSAPPSGRNLVTAARSRQDSWASSAKKIRPLEKKLGRKPATPPNHQKKCCKKFLLQIFEPIFANYF
jgi:hypothetical protein